MESKVINMYDKVKSVKALSREFNVTEDAISRILAKNNRLEWLTLSEDDKVNIENLYKNGVSVKDINKKFNYGQKRITYVLLSKGLMRKRTARSQKDESMFETIDTQEKAYWLGFLMADGYVAGTKRANIELCLQEKDLEHIKKFKAFMKSDASIRKKVTTLKEKNYIAYRITICSKKIVEDLINKGCTPKKSLTLKFPNNDIVPSKLIRHFIRGYFDGDGSVIESGGQLVSSFLGTKDFLDCICSIYNKEVGVSKKVPKLEQRRKSFWTVYFGGNLQNKHIYDYLYKDSTIHLDRKRNKFLAVLG